MTPPQTQTTQGPSPESPWSISKLNAEIKSWIDRLGFVWIEGQITQLNMKDTWRYSYVTLRDTQREASVNLTVETKALRALPSIKDGDRIVACGKPSYYEARGSFSMHITEIRPVGLGDLLARIELLKKQLTAEGLFAPELKHSLPFLPHKVGLITGKDSAAQNDVVKVASERFPGVDFVILNTAVQGPRTVSEVIAAIETLDAQENVDVIIIARGGGSVEDLLPFSEEELLRAVSRASTPIISAIGHEPDNPLLDYVADVRAATPTDAAKRVVPDASEELRVLTDYRARITAAVYAWVERETHLLAQQKSRPALAQPYSAVSAQEEVLGALSGYADRALAQILRNEQTTVDALTSRLLTLGPAATLERGYAIVQTVPKKGEEAEIVTDVGQSPPGTQLKIRVTNGSITAASMVVTKTLPTVSGDVNSSDTS